MTKLLALFAVAGFASSAFANAQTRYVGTDYSCAELQEMLQNDGQLNVVHTIGYGTSYADPKRCDELPYRSRAQKVYERASDTNRCDVGYSCIISGGS